MQILTEEIQTVSIKVSSVKVSSIDIIARDKEAFHCQEIMIVDLDLELFQIDLILAEVVTANGLDLFRIRQEAILKGLSLSLEMVD